MSRHWPINPFEGVRIMPDSDYVPIPILSAAKRLCQVSGWNLSNLELQKMLYIAHMYFLGQEGKPLVDGQFQAWDFGPVNPELYHFIKGNKANKVPPEEFEIVPDVQEDHPGLKFLDAVVNQLSRKRLVAITHWKYGAWKMNYTPGIRGLEIPEEDILEEYKRRKKYNSRN